MTDESGEHSRGRLTARLLAVGLTGALAGGCAVAMLGVRHGGRHREEKRIVRIEREVERHEQLSRRAGDPYARYPRIPPGYPLPEHTPTPTVSPA